MLKFIDLKMLYLVPTPIGNLEDISSRALRILREVRAAYCEDTRRTRVLFSHYGIHTPLVRYQDRDEKGVDRILDRLKGGEDLALVSDSGSPVVSDPGWKLVCRAHQQRLGICSLPGPCAAVTAVAGSGLPGDSFIFLGFLPRSPAKQRRALVSAAALEKTLVIYESPYRIQALLKTVEETLGETTQTALCRELSKVHEEWVTGTARETRSAMETRAQILGEFVLVLHPKPKLVS